MDENKQGREYKYQKDISIGGTMFHIRCDDWKEFVEACNNIEVLVNQVVPNVTPKTATEASAGAMAAESVAKCKTCGEDTLPEKRITGRDGRSWWVRDCVTGDKTHKGPIRAAN